MEEGSVAPLLFLLRSKHVLIGTLRIRFDESPWAWLVDSMTVYAMDRIVPLPTCGVEIES